MGAPLSTREADTLCFIGLYAATNRGLMPTLSEIAEGVGIKGKAPVHRLLCELEARGLIRRLSRKPRAIELLVPPPATRLRDGTPLFFIPVASGDPEDGPDIVG